jgi:hypothetical protein
MDGIGAGAASAPSICSSGIYRNLLHCVLAVVPTALDAAQSPQRKPAERCLQRSFAALMTPAQPSEADVCLKKRQYSPSVAFDDIQTNDGSQPLSRFGAPRDCPSCCVGAPGRSGKPTRNPSTSSATFGGKRVLRECLVHGPQPPLQGIALSQSPVILHGGAVVRATLNSSAVFLQCPRLVAQREVAEARSKVPLLELIA